MDETVETLKELISFLNSDVRTITDLSDAEIKNLVRMRFFFKMIDSEKFDDMINDYLHFLISRSRKGRMEVIELAKSLINVEKEKEEEEKRESKKRLADIFFTKISG